MTLRSLGEVKVFLPQPLRRRELEKVLEEPSRFSYKKMGASSGTLAEEEVGWVLSLLLSAGSLSP